VSEPLLDVKRTCDDCPAIYRVQIERDKGLGRSYPVRCPECGAETWVPGKPLKVEQIFGEPEEAHKSR